MTIKKIPAYGFESASNPAKPRVVAAQKAVASMQAKKDSGHPLYKNVKVSSVDTALKRTILMANISRVAGYIPLICNFQGVQGLCMMAFSSTARKNTSLHLIERSLIQCTGLGIINLPIDIIASCVKNHKKTGISDS